MQMIKITYDREIIKWKVSIKDCKDCRLAPKQYKGLWSSRGTHVAFSYKMK